MAERLFLDASAHGALQLQGKQLTDGDTIEIHVFRHWLPGHLEHDSTGWYLVTPDQVGVRLRAGLLARLLEEPPLSEHQKAAHQEWEYVRTETSRT